MVDTKQEIKLFLRDNKRILLAITQWIILVSGILTTHFAGIVLSLKFTVRPFLDTVFIADQVKAAFVSFSTSAIITISLFFTVKFLAAILYLVVGGSKHYRWIRHFRVIIRRSKFEQTRYLFAAVTSIFFFIFYSGSSTGVAAVIMVLALWVGHKARRDPSAFNVGVLRIFSSESISGALKRLGEFASVGSLPRRMNSVQAMLLGPSLNISTATTIIPIIAFIAFGSGMQRAELLLSNYYVFIEIDGKQEQFFLIGPNSGGYIVASIDECVIKYIPDRLIEAVYFPNPMINKFIEPCAPQ